LVDLPGEGHGVLVARQWVVTAGHATQGYLLNEVWVRGKQRKVAQLILYPGFRGEYTSLKEAAQNPTLKNWPSIESKLLAVHDIALIKLAEPVDDVAPVMLYRGSQEQGKIAEILGKGATGNGTHGQSLHSPHRGKLRRAYNRISHAHEQWLDYQFTCNGAAPLLEGAFGDGDSGGPVLIKSGHQWQLAGLSDWKHWPTGRSQFIAGVCGQEFSNTRISYYAAWMDSVINADLNGPGGH
jgi:hypothetical protein